MLFKHAEPIQGIANYEELRVYSAFAGRQIHEVRLDAFDFAELAKLPPAELSDWVSRVLCRFPPGAPRL